MELDTPRVGEIPSLLNAFYSWGVLRYLKWKGWVWMDGNFHTLPTYVICLERWNATQHFLLPQPWSPAPLCTVFGRSSIYCPLVIHSLVTIPSPRLKQISWKQDSFTENNLKNSKNSMVIFNLLPLLPFPSCFFSPSSLFLSVVPASLQQAM